MEGALMKMKTHCCAVVVLAFAGVAVPVVAHVAPATQMKAPVSALQVVPLVQPKTDSMEHAPPTDLARGSAHKCAQGSWPQPNLHTEESVSDAASTALVLGRRCPT